MGILGPRSLFAYFAAVLVLLGSYGIFRMSRRAAVPQVEQEAFVPVGRSSQAALVLPVATPGDPIRGDSPAAPERIPTNVAFYRTPFVPQRNGFPEFYFRLTERHIPIFPEVAP